MWNRWKARADDFRVLDEDRIESQPIHYGSEVLREQLRAVKPRIHLFGHVHAGYGTLRQGGITYVNASLSDDNGELRVPMRVKIGQ